MLVACEIRGKKMTQGLQGLWGQQRVGSGTDVDSVASATKLNRSAKLLTSYHWRGYEKGDI